MKVIGKVVDNNDPHLGFRLKVSIKSYNSEIAVENMEWIEQGHTSLLNMGHIPNIDEYVIIDVDNGNMSWYYADLKDKSLIEYLADDYLSSIILSYRELENQGDEGVMAVLWTKTNGFQIIKRDSQFQIRDDDSLVMTDGNFYVHVVDGKLSLGSETESAEPAVLGDKNFESLTALNDQYRDMANLIGNQLVALGTAAGTTMYTTHLSAILTSLGTTLLSAHAATNYTKTKTSLPKTKSNKITLD